MFQFRLATVLWTVTLWGCFLGYLRFLRVPIIPTLAICTVTVGIFVLPVVAALFLSTWLARRSHVTAASTSVPRETIDKVANDDLFHVKHPNCHGVLFHVKRADHQGRIQRKSGST